jgi:glutamate racemase
MPKAVVFVDSGVGGLSYFARFMERAPRADVFYVADRVNFPYGAKTKDELSAILCALAARLDALFGSPIVVLACNTASVSALSALRARFPGMTFVGTVPAVKPAALKSASGKIGVLGTERTVSDPYIARLAEETGMGVEIIRAGAPSLVDFVEKRFLEARAEERRAAVESWVAAFRAAGVDGIVLGCTHFLFLLEEFRAAAPDITIFDSVEGVCQRTEALAAPGYSSAGEEPRRTGLFVTGGAPVEEKWRLWASRFGMSVAILEGAL